MVESTEVQFALSEDVHIAYKVVGSGPIDLVSVEGSFSHLETKWELLPTAAITSDWAKSHG